MVPETDLPIILLVDDQAIVAEAFRRLVSKADGLRLEYCQDPKLAMDVASKVKPAVILLDLVMPDVDGFTVLKFFQHHPQLRDIPIIMCSNRESARDKAEAFARGASDYLVKMPEQVELLARLRYHARSYIQRRERDAAYLALNQSRKELELLNTRLAERAQVAEELFQRFMDNSPTLASIKDSQGRYVYMNRRQEDLLGLRPKDWEGKLDSEFRPPDVAGDLLRQDLEVLAQETPRQGIEEGHWMTFRFPLRGLDGEKVLGSVAVDLSQLLQAEEALRRSEERYALAVKGANDGIWDWDLQRNQIYYSPRWLQILGYKEGELGHSPVEWFERVHGDDLAVLKDELDTYLAGASSHFQVDYRIRHQDRSFRWVRCRGSAVRNAQGVAYRLAGSQSDVTEQKQAETDLMHAALHDALTGLPNRSFFLRSLALAQERAAADPGYRYAVLFLDLDGFKLVNDSLGHLAGDRLLILVAERLKKVCQKSQDIVCRLGGDEFTLLLQDLGDFHDALTTAESILEQFKKPVLLDGQEAFVGASIGIVRGDVNVTPLELLRDADTAMYRAKVGVKGRYQVFDDGMRDQAVSRFQLETALRQGLERQEFFLHFQPVVELSSGHILGFEALLRWQHPQRGVLLPAEFLPAAIESGLIVPLGDSLLREALSACREWHLQLPDSPRPFVCINLSRKQLERVDFAQDLKALMSEIDIPAGAVRLEITDSVLARTTEAELASLAGMELQFSLDDFGAGYLFLNRSRPVQFVCLKVDRALVEGLTSSKEAHAIVAAALQLAQSLGLATAASGVETPEQLAELKSLGCQCAQGFLFSVPVSAAEALELLKARFRHCGPNDTPAQAQ